MAYGVSTVCQLLTHANMSLSSTDAANLEVRAFSLASEDKGQQNRAPEALGSRGHHLLKGPMLRRRLGSPRLLAQRNHIVGHVRVARALAGEGGGFVVEGIGVGRGASSLEDLQPGQRILEPQWIRALTTSVRFWHAYVQQLLPLCAATTGSFVRRIAARCPRRRLGAGEHGMMCRAVDEALERSWAHITWQKGSTSP